MEGDEEEEEGVFRPCPLQNGSNGEENAGTNGTGDAPPQNSLSFTFMSFLLVTLFSTIFAFSRFSYPE